MYLSQIYGCCVESPIELPGLDCERVPIQHMRREQPPKIRLSINYASASYENRETEFEMGRLNGTNAQLGSFTLDAQEVSLQVKPNLPKQHLLSFVLGSGLGLQLYLQNTIPMHGMAFANADGTASLVFGLSGSGKSTLTAAMIAAGIPVFSDDILPVVEINQQLWIQPAHRRLKLSASARAELEAMNLSGADEENPSSDETAYPGTQKVAWVAPKQCLAHTPMRITRCYLLRKIREGVEGKRGKELQPAFAMNVYKRHLYRPHVAKVTEMHTVLFNQVHLLAKQAPCRPLFLPDIESTDSLLEYSDVVRKLLMR